MLHHLAFSLILCAIGAEDLPLLPEPAPAAVPAVPPSAGHAVAPNFGAPRGYSPSGYHEAGGFEPSMGYDGNGFGDCHCDRYGHERTPCYDFWHPPCTMSQRIEYWPVDHGYYYFRPYHMSHVAQQREIARSWGEDPRNPYDHKVFDRVYATLRSERSASEEGPVLHESRIPRGRKRSAERREIRPAAFSTDR
jgi:hypothetical protein